MSSAHLLKVSRLEGLTDGIFSIAMTIMVLNLHVPSHAIDSVHLIQSNTYYNLFIYVGSFIILGTHWIAMNFQWGLLHRLNRIYLWTNMFYLMVICVVPFSANLLGEFPHHISSIHFYAINLLCASFGQFLVLHCAHYFNLFRQDIYAPGIYRAALLRLSIAPIFYVTSLVVAHWQIKLAFILLVAPTIIYLIPGRVDKYESLSSD